MFDPAGILGGRLRRLGSVERHLLWIFGSPRSGSTWLLNLIAAGGDVIKIDEPGLGTHLGVLPDVFVGLRPIRPGTPRVLDLRAKSSDYFFAEPWEASWRRPLRHLILSRFRAQLGSARLAALKEPHGSQAADLIMSLLPGSRMIFLLRDGRDVIDSELDAVKPTSWAMRNYPGFELGDRLDFIRYRAYAWLWRTQAVQRAYEGHDPDLRYMLRYEELRADPDAALLPLAVWLSLPADRLIEAGRQTSFERLDPSKRGAGEFVRAAEPGLWRQNLDETEQGIVEGIIGPKLKELGYAG